MEICSYVNYAVLFFLQSSLVAIIVPDPETLPGFAKEKYSLTGDMEQLCENEVGVNSEHYALSEEVTISFTKYVRQYYFFI